MAGLGGPEGAGCYQFRDRFDALFAQLLYKLQSHLFLRFLRIEYGGPILPAFIPAIDGRIVDFEKVPGECGKIRCLRVESDLYGFCVAGKFAAYRFVGGVVGLASGIAYPGEIDAGQPAEGVFFTPETAGGENGY